MSQSISASSRGTESHRVGLSRNRQVNNQLVLTDKQSPLYYTATMIHGRFHRQWMFGRLSMALLSGPDAIGQDALSRFGVAAAGAFDDHLPLM